EQAAARPGAAGAPPALQEAAARDGAGRARPPRSVIDTHAHLDMLEDPAAAVERARDAGVTRILTIGTEDAVELADRFDDVWAVVGHPPPRGGADNALDALRELLRHPKAVAVGEIGLDYFRDYAPRDRQHALFEAQLQIARETGKPVVIHTRAADE